MPKEIETYNSVETSITRCGAASRGSITPRSDHKTSSMMFHTIGNVNEDHGASMSNSPTVGMFFKPVTSRLLMVCIIEFFSLSSFNVFFKKSITFCKNSSPQNTMMNLNLKGGTH